MESHEQPACSRGLRAALGAKAMFRRCILALLDGGLEKWIAERRPLSSEIPQAKTTTLVVSPRPEILVDTKAMRDLSQKKPGSVALVDARPTKEFTGEQLSEDVVKPGHIPG